MVVHDNDWYMEATQDDEPPSPPPACLVRERRLEYRPEGKLGAGFRKYRASVAAERKRRVKEKENDNG